MKTLRSLARRSVLISIARNVSSFASKRSQESLGLNVFCPTGDGGGVDPTCSPGGAKGSYKQTMRGEYWLQGGRAVSADGDVDDVNHIGLAVLAAASRVADVLRNVEGAEDWDWDEGDISELDAKVDELIGEDAKLDLLYKGGVDNVTYQVALDVGNYDPRVWAAKEEGWIRLAGNDAQMVGISRSKLKELADGLYDAYGEDVERQSFNLEVIDPESAMPNRTIKSKVYNEVPYAVIAEGRPQDLREFITNKKSVLNVFCPTGPGGGVDPTCSPGSSGRLPFGQAADIASVLAGQWPEGFKPELKSFNKAERRENISRALEHIGVNSDLIKSVLKKWSDPAHHKRLVKEASENEEGSEGLFLSKMVDKTNAEMRLFINRPLWRGFRTDDDPSKKYKVGSSVDLPLISFSSNKDEALAYADLEGVSERGISRAGKHKVVFQSLDAKGLDMFMADDKTQEFITRGKFKITGVVPSGTKKDPFTIVVLKSDESATENAFCPTGEGGGRDPTCSPKSITTKQGETLTSAKRAKDKWVLHDGREVPEHVKKAAVPPAWTDVYVNLDANGALLATGKDVKGRAQYRYSASHSGRQAEVKFKRTRELMKKRAQIMKEVDADAKDPALREVAECLKLVMKTGIRPGGGRETDADFESFGATTLQGRHVKVNKDGTVTLSFVPGKSHGETKTFHVTDPSTAAMLRRRAATAGPKGSLFNTTSEDLRNYSKTKDGGGFKTKDHRTALATEAAIERIKSLPAPKNKTQYKKAVRALAVEVSNLLGNTPSIALKSYIDPSVFGAWRKEAGV